MTPKVQSTYKAPLLKWGRPEWPSCPPSQGLWWAGSVGARRDPGLETGPRSSQGPAGQVQGHLLEPLWEGGGEGNRRWQPARPPCHPQQEGGGDKRVDLSGGWNAGEEGGGAPGQALAPHTGWGGWVPHPLPPRGHRLTESYLKPGLCTLGTSLS